MSRVDDKSIVDLYFQRSELAIFETSKKYGGYCYAIAYGILQNGDDAEECVNDTYNDAWNSIPPHRPALLSAFLGKIARRIAIDKFRKRNAKKRGGGEMPLILDELGECIASEDNIESSLERKRLSEAVASFVKALPETEQKVFLCRYWYMDSINSICKRFGFSESKVKSMLYRTREKLRAMLEKEGFQ